MREKVLFIALSVLSSFLVYGLVVNAITNSQEISKKTATNSQEISKKTATKIYVGGISASNALDLQIVMDQLTNFLVNKGVDAKQIGVEGKTRTGMIDSVKYLGGNKLIYISLDVQDNQFRDTLKVQCFTSDGTILWEETVGAIFHVTRSGIINSLLAQMKEKLQFHRLT